MIRKPAKRIFRDKTQHIWPSLRQKVSCFFYIYARNSIALLRVTSNKLSPYVEGQVRFDPSQSLSLCILYIDNTKHCRDNDPDSC